MKTQKIILAAALLALGAASCQKEKEAITHFTAGMEQSEAKTYLGDDNYFYWESTDEVKVYSNSANGGADFTVTPRSDNATWADLAGFITEGSSYKAIYPAGIAVSAAQVNLPAVQTSADGSLAGFPMYAESSTDEFQFKNLCGALKIHLQQTGCTISRIKVTAGSPISGTYAVSVTEGDPLLGTCTDGSTTTTLILSTAQPIGEGHDFYIYLPAGEYSDMQLTFYQPDGSCCTKSGSVTVERSVCTPVTIRGSLTFGPASNQIWYTAEEQITLTQSQTTRLGVTDHTYNSTTKKGCLTFASTITRIPGKAFASSNPMGHDGGATFTSVTLPASVTSIEGSAFDDCRNLASVTMPGVTSIGKNAFSKTALESVTLPAITFIDENAFMYCRSLSIVELGSGIQTIGDYAFAFSNNALRHFYCRAASAPTIGTGTYPTFGQNTAGILHVPAGSDYSAWEDYFSSTVFEP